MSNTLQQTNADSEQQQENQWQSRLRGVDLENDIPALVEFLNAVDAVDKMDRSTSEPEQREWLSAPGFAPQRDARVLENPDAPGKFIAYTSAYKSETTPTAYGNLRVHPEWRNKGIGKALLETMLDLARQNGATALQINASERMPAAIHLLEQRGFQPTVTWLEMRIEADKPLDPATMPQGYTVKSYDQVNDPAILLEALNRGFIGHWDHHDETPEGLQHWLATESVRPDGIFLAFGPEGDVAGLCWTIINKRSNERRGEQRGYIDTLAVIPEHRRHGLGRAILLHGMNWLRDNGMGPITLHVYGENERAFPLYSSVGMSPNKRDFEYQLEL